jgi:Amt family ammonium transporter
VFCASSLGGIEPADFTMGHQVWVQGMCELLTSVWSGVVAGISYKICDLVVGLRVTEESERQGLDITTHGEVAYYR